VIKISVRAVVQSGNTNFPKLKPIAVGMGYASYLVWKEGGGSLPLSLYGIQLVMNLAWSPLFFKKHEIGFALLDITGTQLSANFLNLGPSKGQLAVEICTLRGKCWLALHI
jgi:hypothetical protein